MGVMVAVFFLLGSIKLLAYVEQPEAVALNLKPYVSELIQQKLIGPILFTTPDRSNLIAVRHGTHETFGNFGAFIGAISLVLAAIGLLFNRRRSIRFLAAMAVATFLLAEGTLYEYALRYIPVLDSLLRMPVRLLLLFVLFVGVLAGAGFDCIAGAAGKRRVLLTVVVVCAVVLDLGAASTKVMLPVFSRRTMVTPSVASEPTLVTHANVSDGNRSYAGSLVRAGYLLPQLCGDQNNVPTFTADIIDQAPLASSPVSIGPNEISVRASGKPEDIVLRETFQPDWIPSSGTLLPSDDGAMHLVTRTGTPANVHIRLRTPFSAAEIVLAMTFALAGTAYGLGVATKYVVQLRKVKHDGTTNRLFSQ